jgi:type II secretion system protein G
MTLLLAIAFLLQDDPTDNRTDAAFRKIEDAVRGAKTLQLTFSVSPMGPSDPNASITGALALGQGNKLYCSCRAVQKSDQNGAYVARDYWVVSDGSQLMSSETPGVLFAVPKTFGRIVRWMVLVVGVQECLSLSEYLDEKQRPETFGYACFETSKITGAGFDQGNGSRGTFKVTVDLHREKKKHSYLLAVDLQGPRILSHADYGPIPVKIDAGFTEDYQTFELNADIPDEKFKLPNEGQLKESAIAKAKADLRSLRISLASYEVDNGRYPTTQEGLEALLRDLKGAKNWKGPYLEAKELPKDPWGTPYSYCSPGIKNPQAYDLSSLGPDGKPGTADDIEQ